MATDAIFLEGLQSYGSHGAAAEQRADAPLAGFPVEAVVVTVHKPAAPLPGATLGAAGVRIRRTRAGGDA
jgi:hypothetical protein